MIRYDRRFRVFAMCLASLAGFVDAAGFVISGGLFVSFMSGNSTRFAVAFTDGSSVAMIAAGLVSMFFCGVVAGALLVPWKPGARKSVILIFSTAALLVASVLATAGLMTVAALLLAFAMGSLNNVFLREGEVSIGVTYMTGTLVRAGQRVAAAMMGNEPSDWLPYLLLWASLVGGASAGAFFASVSPALSAWMAAALGGLMALFAFWLENGGDRTMRARANQ